MYVTYTCIHTYTGRDIAFNQFNASLACKPGLVIGALGPPQNRRRQRDHATTSCEGVSSWSLVGFQAERTGRSLGGRGTAV